MSKFLYIGEEVTQIDDKLLKVEDQLKPDIYQLMYNEARASYFLSTLEAMKQPDKIYGNHKQLSDRFIQTYFSRKNSNTGILLSGDKGSGKTMILKVMSNELIKSGIPTILINQKHIGEDFNKFIANIKQPCMIAFDEFEKNYDRDEQNQILTLLDGVLSSVKLFIFTANDTWGLTDYIINRPGRIFYHKKFRGVEEEIIKEYSNEMLKNKDYLEELIDISKTLLPFNFDTLQAIIEECNRFEESPKEVVKLLNVTFSTKDSDYTFTVISVDKEEEIHKCFDITGFGSNHKIIRAWYDEDKSTVFLSNTVVNKRGILIFTSEDKKHKLIATPEPNRSNFIEYLF